MADRKLRQSYPDWFRRLAEKWRARLIPEWKLVLSPEPFDDDPPEAQSATNAAYKVQRVWIDFGHRCNPNRRAIEETLVHELLHAPFEAIEEACRPAFDQLSKRELKLVKRQLFAEQERSIEALAKLLVALDHGDQIANTTVGLH